MTMNRAIEYKETVDESWSSITEKHVAKATQTVKIDP